MNKYKIEITEEIVAQFGVGFFIAISTIGATFFALGAHQKYVDGQWHICAVLLSNTFMFTVANRWWLALYFDGMKSIGKHELSPNQRFSTNLCSLLVVLAISLPFLFVSNTEQLLIPGGVLLSIVLLQLITYGIGKFVDLKKIKYNTKLEFNAFSLLLFFFITVTVAEYFNAQLFPVPVVLAYFTFGIFLLATTATLCLWVCCVKKIYKQVTELPALLQVHNEVTVKPA